MRLAHCSDLHLLSHDGARWLDLANKRWIGAMNLLSNRSRHYHVDAFDHMVDDMNAQGIEHVLCTGDVTNLALEQEFEFARAKFDRARRAAPSNVTVIPGNHDAYVAEGIALLRDDVRRRITAPIRAGSGPRPTATDRRRRSALADRPRARRARADRPVDLARDAVVHRVRPRRRRAARAARARRSPIRGSPARRGSSRSTIRPPASARTSKIRGLRDHAAFARGDRRASAPI